MIQYASREMILIHLGQADSEIKKKKTNLCILQPGNTPYMSELRSSSDGCQLGKHLSPLPAC